MSIVGHLYKITRISTDEYYYGIHKGMKFDGYWGSGRIIKDYVRTHGTNDLKYDVLVIGSYDYILFLESLIVNEREILKENCWNLKVGGYRGLMSEKSKKIISQKQIGRKHSSERNEKIQNSRRKNIESIGAKISKSNLGKKRTKEQCENISKGRKKSFNDASRINYSKSKSGIKNSQWKGYVQTDQGIFESTMAAAIFYKCTDVTIAKRCKSENKKYSQWRRIFHLPCNIKVITKEDLLNV